MNSARPIKPAFIAVAMAILIAGCAANTVSARITSPVNDYPPSASITPKVDMSIWSREPMAEDRSHFMFSGWSGPAIPVWAFVPEGIDRTTAPVMFLLHGAKRDPRRYLEEWTDLAQQDGFIIIAPEYAKGSFRTSRQYNLGNIIRSKTRTIRPKDKWSFSAIEPLFDYAIAKLGGQQKNYTLYGHSAGSQFVHRFLFTMPEARIKRVLAANAGWYTMPDTHLDYPYGLGKLNLTEDTIKAALAKDVVILLGDQDINAQHESLNRSKEAIKQGPHRFARGKSYFKAAKKLAEEMDTDFGWTLRIIPGVAHSNGGIAQGAHDLVE